MVTIEEIAARVERLEAQPTDKATKPSVVNVVIVSTNTEYRHMLPMGCKRFQAQLRTAADFKMAVMQDVLGRTTPENKYFTVKSGTVFKADGLKIDRDVWLYFQGNAGTVVELIQWV